MNSDLPPWEPAAMISREEIIKTDKAVRELPDLRIAAREDIFRIKALGMDWDIGAMIYEPEDRTKIAVGPDGKKAGIFLLHGGVSDYQDLDGLARLLAGKFGFKTASMTFPGRLYLLDPSRDWPGDTLNPDGTGRTPLWTKETAIGPEQYTIVRDISKRKHYGTIISLQAKEGTEFYDRLAAWPAAFDEAMRETCRRHLPADQYAIYVHGHSTGGPFAMIAAQRVANIRGIIGYGTSTFGYMYPLADRGTWDAPFNSLRMRTWADTARYVHEGIKDKGYGLPLQMELVFEQWEIDRKRPNFKAEDIIHKNGVRALAEAARVTARRLAMTPEETEALVRKFVGYCRELSGPDVKPVPSFLSVHGIDDDTVGIDHARRILPLFASLQPAPKVRNVLLGAGVHLWTYSDGDLPEGIIPTVVKLWHESIMAGYFI